MMMRVRIYDASSRGVVLGALIGRLMGSLSFLPSCCCCWLLPPSMFLATQRAPLSLTHTALTPATRMLAAVPCCCCCCCRLGVRPSLHVSHPPYLPCKGAGCLLLLLPVEQTHK